MTDAKEQDRLDRLLLDAVKSGDSAGAAQLLTQGADANARLADERAMLYYAVEANDAEMVRLLAPRVKYLDVTDANEFSFFTHAVRLKYPEVAHALLDCGASAFPPGQGAEYPLDWAVGNRMHGLVERMLKNSGWPDRHYKGGPLIVYAAEQDDLDLARACLNAGVDINRGAASNGQTALHVAARKGSEPFVRLLVDSGADLDARANGTQTIFDWAGRHETLVRAVISERDMRLAARAMTEGVTGVMTVNRPLQLHKKPGVAP